MFENECISWVICLRHVDWEKHALDGAIWFVFECGMAGNYFRKNKKNRLTLHEQWQPFSALLKIGKANNYLLFEPVCAGDQIECLLYKNNLTTNNHLLGVCVFFQDKNNKS